MSTKTKRTVVKGALKVLAVDDLKTDPSYQRDVKAKHKKIVAEFNEEALGIPVVGERSDGTLWIVDGYQRITALRVMGRTRVRAEVFASRGAEHEAEVFKLINLNRTKLSPGEEFRALLTAHDADAWDIKKTGEAAGYSITLGRDTNKNPEKGAKQITCINTLRDAAKRDGLDAIAFALTTIKAAWPDDPMGSYNYVIGGLCIFFRHHERVVDMDRLIPRLRTMTPHKVLYAASMMNVGSGGKNESAAEVLERIYRKRLVSSKKGS